MSLLANKLRSVQRRSCCHCLPLPSSAGR